MDEQAAWRERVNNGNRARREGLLRECWCDCECGRCGPDDETTAVHALWFPSQFLRGRQAGCEFQNVSHAHLHLTDVLQWSAAPSRQYVRFFRISYAVTVGEALELLHNARSNLFARFALRGGDKRRNWCSGQMMQDKSLQARQVNVDPTDANLHVGKARFGCKTP